MLFNSLGFLYGFLPAIYLAFWRFTGKTQRWITLAIGGYVFYRNEDFLTRVRLRAGRAIDRTFVDDAPLARALLIADQHEIPTEMRDRYAAAGIIHMLSISGLSSRRPSSTDAT